MKPVIFGIEGKTLSDAEKAFFTEQKPYGFILFARNIESPDQLRALTDDLRETAGRGNIPVLIDQEGGRVQRMRSPHWFDAKPFAFFGDLHATAPDLAAEALRLTSRIIAGDLRAGGINVNCTPCLDLRLPETVGAIGDRAFSDDPELNALLGGIVAREFLAAGIMPVIKHMPGHGRATVDSHLELPHVTAPHATLSGMDFAAFKALSLLPWGMTSHIVFEDIDPDHPATQSKKVIEEIIRGEIGFDGLLLTDDLNMSALSGSLGERAEIALDAGVDIILHCSGILTEMEEVAAVCPPMPEKTKSRVTAGGPVFGGVSSPLDPAADHASLEELLSSLGRT
ncbi:MAG: beta-N-acetylhexosaminidase [Alphaproteobacteria bacterium]|nr:MAG: beta-N-acetylhexosaminidase [Alphaproteobacteria bacterium]